MIERPLVPKAAFPIGQFLQWCPITPKSSRNTQLSGFEQQAEFQTTSFRFNLKHNHSARSDRVLALSASLLDLPVCYLPRKTWQAWEETRKAFFHQTPVITY